ncbi:fluoride efflux transporter FluC [Paeniglutamicibacter cryotolerans]
MAGGCFGASARYGLELLLPAPYGWPVPTLIINVFGAFLLGVLLEGLVRRGPDTGRRRFLRLLVGTGFMGAFTTYSSLSVDAMHLFDAGRGLVAFLYLGASLLLGTGAAFVGIWAAARQYRQPPGHDVDPLGLSRGQQ